MWLCLKAGPEPGMKFLKPPISKSDDSAGSWVSFSWLPRWLLISSMSEQAGKECGCECLNGGWEAFLH